MLSIAAESPLFPVSSQKWTTPRWKSTFSFVSFCYCYCFCCYCSIVIIVSVLSYPPSSNQFTWAPPTPCGTISHDHLDETDSNLQTEKNLFWSQLELQFSYGSWNSIQCRWHRAYTKKKLKDGYQTRRWIIHMYSWEPFPGCYGTLILSS